ncbi:hypothetical protein YH65_04580 [Sulfurovum lithotrophicum]|uniref:Uncharacterized protein n=1 Tax=Sulfurovum lithotrophicum TaxID=206403 RepID=A0A7U4RQJ5_9BACT|nr:hypothetical protein YH65_04580 [Sulfurovum lithotrophicum]
MKWNKEAVVIVGIIFFVSYIYNLESDSKMSHQIETQQLNTCRARKQDHCDLIELFHNTCFKTSYRSYMRAKHFYTKEYEDCLQKKIDAFLKE